MRAQYFLYNSCVCIFLLLFSTSCGENDATTQDISKESSVEVIISTQHLNQKYDIIKTTRRIYVDNKLIKESFTFDTIPALGNVNVKDEEDDKVKTVQKDYDIFVTVQ
ncbi:MAG: hypothetical protein NZ455_05405 [Bacteroidia bacterium]|nr:hypothetical protein [Bacteroidia bacterium]MDW8345435.1 hypothetical protein [Bacteroidia bacterium]